MGVIQQSFRVTFVKISKYSNIVTMSLHKINIYSIFKYFSVYTFPSLTLVELDTHMIETSTIFLSLLTYSQIHCLLHRVLKIKWFQSKFSKSFLSGHFSEFAWLYLMIYTFLMSFVSTSVKFMPDILAIIPLKFFIWIKSTVNIKQINQYI